MDLMRRVDEHVMVAEFLRAEINSPRFGRDVRRALEALDLHEGVVRTPDLDDDRENAARAAVLGTCRGYGHDRDMFAGVPTDLAWHETSLSRDEVAALHYVDYSYWNELSGGSHVVRDAVARIRSGVVVYGVPNDRFVELADQICAGRVDLGRIIVWGHGIDGPLELLEGHLRATALGLAGGSAPERIPAIVGLETGRAKPRTHPCSG